ncbi:MAG: hypothetical protein ACOY90_05245 [Candidatus Zhuqueibacterota bacterium]
MNSSKNISVTDNDIVLVYIEQRPTFFARIEAIAPDINRGWWRVKLLILQIPLIVTTWILDNEQIHGAEFTMGGTPMRLEKVVAPPDTLLAPKPKDTSFEEDAQKNQRARIVSLNSPAKK